MIAGNDSMRRRGLLGAAWLAVALAPAWLAGSHYRAARLVEIDVEAGYDRAFLVDFHDPEGGVGSRFRWTKEGSTVVLYHLPAGRLLVKARVRIRRPGGEPLPRVAFVADGVTVHRAEPPGGESEIEFAFPFRGGGLQLGIESDQFVAGERELGIQLLELSVTVADASPPWLVPAAQIGLASLVLSAGLFWGGLPVGWSCLLGGGLAMLASLLMAPKGLAFSSYPRSVLYVFLSGALVACLVSAWARRRTWLMGSWRGVFVATAAGSFVWRLGLVTYPHFLSSDGLFHAYRLIRFSKGEFWLTSVTQHQPPFEIPYPFALFALGAPFHLAGIDPLLVVKALTVVADTFAVMGLMYVGFRHLNDPLAGVVSALIYHLTPVGLLAFSAGNLSNLFATSMTTVAFAAILASHRDGGVARVCGMALASLLALTGHFGMWIEGVVLWPAWALSVWLLVPPPAEPSNRRYLFGGFAVVFALALAYYSGYLGLVSSQWERALSPDYATGALEAVGPIDKLRFNAVFALGMFGKLIPAVTLFGVVSLYWRGITSELHALAAAWLLTTGIFFVVDLFTAIEIRYWLQIFPLFALFSAVYLSSAYRRGGLGRLVALAVGVAIAYSAHPLYWQTLMVRYH